MESRSGLDLCLTPIRLLKVRFLTTVTDTMHIRCMNIELEVQGHRRKMVLRRMKVRVLAFRPI